MYRRALNALLERHARGDALAAPLAQRFREFVGGHADCLLRTCRPGHITASAWILSADGKDRLLTHHRKLGRWLQLGGHVDGEAHVERAALREACEESGMTAFDLLAPHGELQPLDLDVHPIPARGDEPKHLHWDVRFLLRARPGQPLVCSSESMDLRWVAATALGELTQEESVLRLERRALAWLGAGVEVVAAPDGGGIGGT